MTEFHQNISYTRNGAGLRLNKVNTEEFQELGVGCKYILNTFFTQYHENPMWT